MESIGELTQNTIIGLHLAPFLPLPMLAIISTCLLLVTTTLVGWAALDKPAIIGRPVLILLMDIVRLSCASLMVKPRC